MSTVRKRKRTQAFNAPKDKHTKEIIEQNATTSPLLRLPLELRRRIWGYVLGDQLVHLRMAPLVARNSKYYDGRRHLLNTICQSSITEREAYELSKSAEYDKASSSMNSGEDMRVCQNRHADCYKALRGKDRENLPPNRLDINILLVCRQAYVEANPILWSTNTWSFDRLGAWRQWRSHRNSLQRRLIKKVHLALNVILEENIRKTDIQLFKVWEELHIDITANAVKEQRFDQIRQFFPANKITVICIGLAFGIVRKIVVEGGRSTWEERMTMAETLRTHLFSLQKVAEQKEAEKSNSSKKGPQKSRKGKKNKRLKSF